MILLASKSPRRRELLKMLNLPFETVNIKEVEETYSPELSPEEIPMYLSRLKAEAYKDNLKDSDILITADTVVALGNVIMGKPKDLEQAKEMLTELSGRVHKVITGVTITKKNASVTFNTVTEVKFSKLTPEEIDYYVDKYRPLDKAGAYGVQEWIGAVGVESLKGSYYNVMGLPVHRLYKELQAFIPSSEIFPHTGI